LLLEDSGNKVVVTYNRDVHCPRLTKGWWDLREIFNILGPACHLRDSFSISIFLTHFIFICTSFTFDYFAVTFFSSGMWSTIFFEIIILLIMVHYCSTSLLFCIGNPSADFFYWDIEFKVIWEMISFNTNSPKNILNTLLWAI